jgi:ELWxxDGT repeat protein
LLKDINTGGGSSFPGSTGSQTTSAVVNGTLLFPAIASGDGEELWRTDGTAPGTVLVKSINPSSTGSSARHLTAFNGVVLFAANDGVSGTELWKSDGTAVGTVLVKDVLPGAASGLTPTFLEVSNGVVFFAADDGVHGTELWKTDGTAAGTVMVKDIRAGADDSMGQLTLNHSAHLDVNGVLFFGANDGTTGEELWKSDGTSAGTVRVRDIQSGSNDSDPSLTINVNGIAVFGAKFELWRSDGTAHSSSRRSSPPPAGSCGEPMALPTVPSASPTPIRESTRPSRRGWEFSAAPWFSQPPTSLSVSSCGRRSGRCPTSTARAKRTSSSIGLERVNGGSIDRSAASPRR